MRSKLAGYCREPLVHFLAIGIGFFLIWHFYGEGLTRQSERIVITPGHVERLAQHWTKTHLRPPTAEELSGLVEQEIDEEVLYREALAMDLDKDDLVIRKRLAVKMDFLTDDVMAAAAPTDEQLQAFLLSHPEKFNVDSLVSFSQIYLDRSKRGDEATVVANRLLLQLNGSLGIDWQSLGDQLPLPQQFTAAREHEIARLFGREFPKKLATLPLARWSGPIESTYGLHLILIRQRTAGRSPSLAEVRDAVLNEWRVEHRETLSLNLRRQRRAKYAVSIQWPDWAKETVAAPSGTGVPKETR